MARLKKSKIYFFSVEGETERWYLECLENIINSDKSATHKVSIKCDVQKDPVKYAKKITILEKTVVYHLSDYESDETIHVQQFLTTIDRLKKASSDKQITYKFGYSNLTFDLWMILHMVDCNRYFSHRDNYIRSINDAYGEKFENMDEYKHEGNFKRCLKKIQLAHVLNAINRAEVIMQRNKDNGYVLEQHKGYSYYKENPALAIGGVIANILKDCGFETRKKIVNNSVL